MVTVACPSMFGFILNVQYTHPAGLTDVSVLSSECFPGVPPGPPLEEGVAGHGGCKPQLPDIALASRPSQLHPRQQPDDVLHRVTVVWLRCPL